jgi:protein-disulfide isomerase
VAVFYCFYSGHTTTEDKIFGSKDLTPGEKIAQKFKSFFKGRGINVQLIKEKKINIPELKGFNFVIIKLSKGKRSQNLSCLTNGKYMIRSIEEIGSRKNLVSYYEALYTTTKVPFKKSEIIFGKKGAKVNIVYFGDFQCPYCKRCLNFIRGTYKKNVAVYFKHFPLPFHKNAIILAKIFEAGKKLNINLVDFVEKANGDEKKILADVKKVVPKNKWKKFEKILKSKKIMDKIKKDEQLGRTLKITGTPTMFINGHRINGCDISVIKEVISKSLK